MRPSDNNMSILEENQLTSEVQFKPGIGAAAAPATTKENVIHEANLYANSIQREPLFASASEKVFAFTNPKPLETTSAFPNSFMNS